MSPDDVERIAVHLGESAQTDPLYTRILSGIGAWFAAVFLILFLAMSAIFADSTGAIICGISLLVAGIIIAQKSRTTFLSQLSLASVLAGNTLVLIGAATEFGKHELLAVFISHAVLCAVLYPLYADSIYRFLAPIALAALATACIVEEQAFVLIHALIAVEMLLAGLLLLRKKCPPLLVPLAYSAAAMLPATLLFMSLMQTHMWGADFNMPLWPSNILLTGGLLYLYLHLADTARPRREPWLILALVSTLLLGIFTTPGILVAIGLLVVGYAFGDRMLTALAYLFLLCFLLLFYYTLDIDLAHKSWVLVGSGGLLLIVRWLAKRCFPGELTP